MTFSLTPQRRRGVEMLDDPDASPALALRSLRDVARANQLFGGTHAIVREVRAIAAGLPTGAPVRLLDVGTGLGDIAAAAARALRSRNLRVQVLGLEHTTTLAHAARARCDGALVGDALTLPFADASIDIVTCSQLLHHFADAQATQLLCECMRVARIAVVVGDLRRSWLAVAGLWTSSFLLGFHPVSRHDGVVSILRGYTPSELDALVRSAAPGHVTTRRSLGFRVTAVWSPTTGSAAHA